MQYAISNWIYGNEPLRDQFIRLAQYGYEGIELVGEPDRYSIPEVKGLCKEFGVRVSSVLGWSIWGIPGRDSDSPDENERSAALEYCKSCVDLASELGAPILVVLPGLAGVFLPRHRIIKRLCFENNIAQSSGICTSGLNKLSQRLNVL